MRTRVEFIARNERFAVRLRTPCGMQPIPASVVSGKDFLAVKDPRPKRLIDHQNTVVGRQLSSAESIGKEAPAWCAIDTNDQIRLAFFQVMGRCIGHAVK